MDSKQIILLCIGVIVGCCIPFLYKFFTDDFESPMSKIKKFFRRLTVKPIHGFYNSHRLMFNGHYYVVERFDNEYRKWTHCYNHKLTFGGRMKTIEEANTFMDELKLEYQIKHAEFKEVEIIEKSPMGKITHGE